MNYKDKERIESCVVQVECINKYDTNDKEVGTGFFIDKNKIVTASHVINKYYINPSDYDINVIHIKSGKDKGIKVIKTKQFYFYFRIRRGIRKYQSTKIHHRL